METECCGISGDQIQDGDACSSVSAPSGTSDKCPACGNPGRKVQRITLKALLTPSALRRIEADVYRFCPTKTCAVVYYALGSVFRTGDLVVPVWQKSDDPAVPVCYCFGHSENSIREGLRVDGRTTIQEDIKELVRQGRCACEVKNPQGTCCLGNVSMIVNRLRERGHRWKHPKSPAPCDSPTARPGASG